MSAAHHRARRYVPMHGTDRLTVREARAILDALPTMSGTRTLQNATEKLRSATAAAEERPAQPELARNLPPRQPAAACAAA